MKASVFLFALLFSLCCAERAAAQLGDDDNKYDLRIKAILDEIDLDYEITDAGDFKIVIALENKRTQAVYVKSRTEIYDAMEIREIWSLGYSCEGDVPGNIANMLLQSSFDQKIGAWQVIRDDSASVAIFAVKLSANAGASTVRSAIIAAVQSADAVELELTGDTDAF